ncbi:MAG: Piwi domain-containing protein [Sediminibacterium sp.]
MASSINLSFLKFKKQDRETIVFRKILSGERNNEFYYHRFKTNEEKFIEYEVSFESLDGFEKHKLAPYQSVDIIALSLYRKLLKKLPQSSYLIKNRANKYNRKIHFIIEGHPKGKKCVWIEPYFLKSEQKWGLLLDFAFVVDEKYTQEGKFTLDKDIQIASGSLNLQGNSNSDFYIYKHGYIQKFIKQHLPTINTLLHEEVENTLFEIPARQLGAKTYLFSNGIPNVSSYLGLSKNSPLRSVNDDVSFYFIYKQENRDIAVSLLKGLRGETNPTTFSGMEKLFKVPFTNSRIKGTSVAEFNDNTIDAEIEKIKNIGGNVLPIIITNSKKAEEDDKLYFWLKHKFTNANIPCQVVTRDLVRNEYSLKYSLSNIGLQIFAKAGGQPWKMKSTTTEYLIIGIGQSYNSEATENGVSVEKNITYSVLTDSSGLFKDIQVLGEGVENDNYYSQLATNLTNIINGSGYKKISIHCPFRMSRDKILKRVVANIPDEVELSVLVINNKSDFFGYDYSNNGLVPYESTYIKISAQEFLVWFEGLQYNNPKITKRFGNPLMIKFWFTNKPQNFEDYNYKEALLQDCINLSGANWRGFKAKQLPVSVFYCQRIAEFIGKFKQYELEHIEISNLKPWFL